MTNPLMHTSDLINRFGKLVDARSNVNCAAVVVSDRMGCTTGSNIDVDRRLVCHPQSAAVISGLVFAAKGKEPGRSYCLVKSYEIAHVSDTYALTRGSDKFLTVEGYLSIG